MTVDIDGTRPHPVINSDDATVVNVRTCFNPVSVTPWQPVPAAGRTLGDLNQWLKEQGADPNELAGGGFDMHLIDYGDQGKPGPWTQYWVPDLSPERSPIEVEVGPEPDPTEPTTLDEIRRRFKHRNLMNPEPAPSPARPV